MKRIYSWIFLLFSSFYFFEATGQIGFKTIVPQRSITTGESFQVQYIIDNAEKISDFTAPAFQGFRVVSGPHMYSGNSSSSQKNLVFTLAALREGNFKISGATCFVNGITQKSNDVIVKVISPQEPDETLYLLKQGEEPFQKIRENLFLKLSIDKPACFIGEPLVATFKLYSRLQSKSNIIKNPGFYGFSVYDMINVNDRLQSQENFNGHWFDVHTILKVQLYPLQAGTFTIDPMELANEVEFSRSIVNKKTEQEVTENMYGDKPDDASNPNAEVYKLNLKSEPVAVKVRSLPTKNAADTFAGAVGSFSINAFLEKDSVLKNEEDSLIIEINGAGNFQRVGSPTINWPKNIESFEPSVSDTLNKHEVPLTGKRRFRYIFLSNETGQYTIPPISFSFFDLKTRSYKTVSSKPLTVFVKTKAKENKSLLIISAIPNQAKSNWLWIATGGFVIISVGIFLVIKRKKAALKKYEEVERSNDPVSSFTSVNEILDSAKSALDKQDKIFYEELHYAIWNYLKNRLPSSIMRMNKSDLIALLRQKTIDPELSEKLILIIHQCETGTYANAEMNWSKTELLENTRQILRSMDKVFLQT
jgi:hypothetical protein